MKYINSTIDHLFFKASNGADARLMALSQEINPSQQHHRVLLALAMCFLVVFMAGIVSAFEFDNVKNYDRTTKTVTINDCTLWVGKCFIEGDAITTSTLTSPIKVWASVGVDQLVGWFDYQTTEEDVVGSFGELYLENRRNGKPLFRGGQYKVKVYRDVSVDDYKTTCEEVPTWNGTKTECTTTEIGSHIETVWEWMPITSPNINLKPNTLYEMGIFVDVELGDRGEWIPTFSGKAIPEWASYEAEITDAHGNAMPSSDASTPVSVGGAIVPNFNLLLTKVTAHAGSTPTDAIIRYGGNLSILAQNSSKVNDEWSFDITLNANDLYIVSVGAGGLYTAYYGSAMTFPITQTNIKWVWGTTTDGGSNSTQVQTVVSVTTRKESGDSPPNITLNSPSSANYTTDQSLEINFTVWDDINLTDVDLYVNNILNQSNSSGINNTDYIFDLNLGDGDYTIYGRATDDNIVETNSSSIRIVIDSVLPTITSAYNLTDLVTLSLPINSTWHYNATDPFLDSCYYNSTANITQTIITCNSTINTTWTAEGSKTIQFCANDTFGNEQCDTENIFVYYIQETQADSPDPIAETFDATFNFTVNLTSIPTTTATLILNNTEYAPTTTTAGTNGYYFEVTVTIPDGWGNTTGVIQDWFWNYTIDGVITYELTDTETITVYELGIDDCSSYGELIFNFSVLDEETLVEANESLSIEVEADLTLTSTADTSQSLTYSNMWTDNNNPQICVPSGVINNSEYILDLTVGFSSTDHVWEFYYIDNATLNNTKIYEYFNGLTTPNVNLMDLLTADSTSFLFNYFDIDGLAVDGSIVHVMRKYIGDGEFLEVERASQDQNGDTIVHLVEEDVIYFFIITKDGVLLHTSSEYTALCQSTPCTIQIEASSGSAEFPTDWDLMDGGAYQIRYSASTREVQLIYENNASTTMNFTVYKYNSDGSYSAVDQGEDTGLGGTINLTVPQVAGNVSFFATVIKDDNFLNSEWVNFEERASDRFGVILSLFLAGLIILSLGLFAVSEGVGTIVYVILGIVVSGALGLIITDLSTGVNIVIYLVLAGGILLWKLTEGRK